jgi:hypothetical protein
MSCHNRFLVGLLAVGGLYCGQAVGKEEKISLEQVPQRVMSTIKKRFPAAELLRAEKEDEDGAVIFEIQLKDQGQKMDVSVAADGALREIEKSLRAQDLPKAVTKALVDKYGDAKLKLAEEVILVKDGKEIMDCYEVKLETAPRKITEVKVAADGTIKKAEVEDAGKDED